MLLDREALQIMTQDTALDVEEPQALCPVCGRVVGVWMGALRIHVPPGMQCPLVIPALEPPDEGKRCARPAGHLGPCECVGIAIDLESRAAMCKGSRSVPVSDWELRQLAEKSD